MTSSHLVLLSCFVLCYLAAYAFGRWDERRTRRASRRLLRTTSLVLVVSAWWLWLEQKDTQLSGFALGVAVGMSFSFVGDLFTGELIHSRKPYLNAMVVFSLGHLAYLFAMFQVQHDLALTLHGAWWVGALVAAHAGWTLTMSSTTSRLRIPSLFYTYLLFSVSGGGVGLAWMHPAFLLLAGGAVMFGISDILLGYRELRGASWFLIYDLVWACYITGQAAIVWSVPYAGAHLVQP